MKLRRLGAIVVITICCIVLLWLFGGGGKALNPGGNREKDTIHWEELLQSFSKLLILSRKEASNFGAHLDARLAEINASLDTVEQRAIAYRFMLDSYGVSDVFVTMLRCRQIADLNAEFIQIKEKDSFRRSELRKISDRLMRLKSDLQSKLGTGQEKLNNAIDLNIVELDGLLAELARMKKPVLELTPRIEEVGELVESLYDRAQHEREAVIDNVFFKQQQGVNYILAVNPPDSAYMFKWFLKISSWLSIQLPMNMGFWLCFSMLLFSMMVPVLWLEMTFVEPFLYRFKLIAQSRECTHFFRSAVLLFTFSIALYITKVWLNESENMLFIQASKSLAALAMLLFALVLREKECELFSAIRLYLPVIVQHFCGMLLYVTLAPSLPLVLILLPLNLIVTLWILWQLYHFRYHWLDATFAVLSVVTSVISGYLAAIGLPYLAFTLTLGWFVLVAQFQLVIAISQSIVLYVKNNRGRCLVNATMIRFVIPLIWVLAFFRLFEWITATYHLEDYFAQVMDYRFPLPDLVHVDIERMLIALTVAFIIQFVIKFVREWINLKFGNAAESGVIASGMTLGTYLVWAVFALFAMFLCDVDANGVMVMMGGLCVGLGFALKSVAENFIAGLALLIGQQIRSGDIIEVNSSTGQVGRVRKISFSVTTVETEDGATITYPNAQVISKEFWNWTSNNPYRRFDIPIDVPYGADLVKIRQLLSDAAYSVDGVEHSPAPIVFLSSFGSSSITFVIRFWIIATAFRSISTNLRIKVVEVLAANNIEIPFPQLDVHVIPNDSPKTNA